MSLFSSRFHLPFAGLVAAALLAGCAADPMTPAGLSSSSAVPREYQARADGERVVPAVDPAYLVERNRRRWVEYEGPEAPGTVVIDPYARLLYHIVEEGKAMRFGIAVGKEGRGFSGNAVISRKEEYPYWQPTARMVRSDPALYGPLAGGLQGGLDNPLGARALYLYRNGRDTYYRIHGTMDPSSIGKATSAGCIRLFNQDIIDMFDETELGTKVRVRTRAESLEMEGPMHELHSGYVVPADAEKIIAADEAAWEAGKIRDAEELEAEQHAAAVASAEERATN
ncbi:lipoprotein-anchoring transpeptidase ErfK/SrfK [Rhodobacter sp. JA431]|uniref:L,D-transpeptidase n=1 Tax=Rhodobacter sp. JA431 TaxID=570013 RepID=UPI000BD30EB2|nr:L,D-transpeptidase [Rhodobacter sp. JA431]SOB92762.1 lipoprotein-anchoring transpeptidase ErfK/SrfK [Rhodobacter sp. JA431]